MSEFPINQIVQGDCQEIMKDFPEESVDLVITDPPFLTVFGTTTYNSENYNNADLGALSILEGWWKNVLTEIDRLQKKHSLIFTFCDWRTYPAFYRTHLKIGQFPVNLIVWNHSTGRRYSLYRYAHTLITVFSKEEIKFKPPSGTQEHFDVWEFDTVPTKNRILPAEKPVKLIRRIISQNSEEGDVILDPFLGSGTTAIACRDLNRRWIGIELNQNYVKIARERISSEPSQKLEEFV